MIDTVVLSIDLLDPATPAYIYENMYDQWTPNLNGIMTAPYIEFGRKKYITAQLSPSDQDIKEKRYMPRVTLTKGVREGGFGLYLRIEFSASKILFGNNFDELEDGDLDAVCERLSYKLHCMGIAIDKEVLKVCHPKDLHYGKNIVYTDGTTPAPVIRYINKSNITTRKNTDERGYKNGGEACHFYNNVSGFCVYDKRKELQNAKRTEKGNLEKDNACQLSLLNTFHLLEPFQVLRIEARNTTKKSIREVLRKVGVVMPETPTLADLFKKELARKVLMYEMQVIEDNMPIVAKNRENLADFMANITAMNPKSTFAQRIKAVAMKAVLYETGTRDFRKQIGATNSQWSRFIADVNSLNCKTRGLKGFEEIGTQLYDFKSVKLKDYVRKDEKAVDIVITVDV
ncbi:MAG: hypothetical protein LBM97_01865 [Candidatus Nomurabacteria bacterium]|jgi:hypothetical protein|nr:hypothetical protein [Candidatus Nomurabacteria bacterium]